MTFRRCPADSFGTPQKWPDMTRHLRARLDSGLMYLVVAITLLWTVFPFWSAFTLSIKHRGDFFTPKFFPFIQFQPTLENWRAEFREFGNPSGLGFGLLNSVLVALLTSGLSPVLLPPPLLALLARRYRVRGLSLGAVGDENRR
jgi:ABC-type glycerol-3-phosphate transport system permease component